MTGDTIPYTQQLHSISECRGSKVFYRDDLPMLGEVCTVEELEIVS
ncbi:MULTISPECIES: hypothetical protein [unclassified Methanosarcina]|nr:MULTISPECIES: hypothetical protein [unclassified Methanosarcina]